MNRQTFYKRVTGVVDPERLARRRVAIVGLGSGGSRLAVELGRLGVGLLLIERPGERIEEHNIVRHYLGYKSLGKLKLPEMKRAIRNLNPSTKVRSQELDVVENRSDLITLLEQWRPDVIGVCTDNEQSKHAVNQVALRLGIPQVGAGVYDAGIGGEVYRIQAGGACYGCIAEHLQLQRYTAPEQIRPDYNHLDSAPAPSACALNLDVAQIASLQARLVLDALLGPEAGFVGLPSEINLCVFANRIVPGTFTRPWHADFYQVGKRPDCMACGTVANDWDDQANRILAALDVPNTAVP